VYFWQLFYRFVWFLFSFLFLFFRVCKMWGFWGLVYIWNRCLDRAVVAYCPFNGPSHRSQLFWHISRFTWLNDHGNFPTRIFLYIESFRNSWLDVVWSRLYRRKHTFSLLLSVTVWKELPVSLYISIVTPLIGNLVSPLWSTSPATVAVKTVR